MSRVIVYVKVNKGVSGPSNRKFPETFGVKSYDSCRTANIRDALLRFEQCKSQLLINKTV